MKQIITIIDYGSGNLRSVYNALKLIDDKNYQFNISSNPLDLKTSDKIILPGVGAFADCIDSLSNIDNMINSLKEEILIKKKNFLGICVGMQLLADFGYEYQKKSGLGFIHGDIKKIDNHDQKLKIPHIGWNEVQIIRNHNILNNINDKEHFYFVHSYHFLVKNSKDIIATVNYGDNLAAIIAKDNIIATQFHPEKSGISGLKLLENFINL
ncbi:imidazole glycerol phosphate synthase subunit HisH [Rickettsiales bacterium]|nr:imidazole glycerol phosphate synthase subunit HisH [Rickettsiales bacterium]